MWTPIDKTFHEDCAAFFFGKKNNWMICYVPILGFSEPKVWLTIRVVYGVHQRRTADRCLATVRRCRWMKRNSDHELLFQRKWIHGVNTVFLDFPLFHGLSKINEQKFKILGSSILVSGWPFEVHVSYKFSQSGYEQLRGRGSARGFRLDR